VKDAFWSQSFCLLTAGGAPIEVIRGYIETQGEKGNEKSIPVPDLSGS
jgi:putative transposase